MPSTSVHNLGVVLDSELSMSKHINKVNSNCFYQPKQLRTVHRSLSIDIAIMLKHVFISSGLDYYNSFIFGTISLIKRKLRAVQNAAARLVSSLSRYEHITPTLMDLHWLKVRQSIDYKIALLVYKVLHGSGSQYLIKYCALLSTANQNHQLSSATRGEFT